MDHLDEELVRLRQELVVNVYNLQNHDKLIQILRLKRDWHGLQHARIQKLYLVTFTTRELSDWLEDLQQLGEYDLIIEFYDLVVKDYPIVTYWEKYLQFAIDLVKNDKVQNIYDPVKLQELFTRALNDTMDDFKNSHIIWRLILNYMIEEYDKTKASGEFETIFALFKLCLSKPHEQLDQSFQFYSQFLSKFVELDYEKYILPMNKIYANTKKKLRYFEIHEIRLLSNPNPEAWIDYMNQVNKYSKPDQIDTIATIFERSVKIHDTQWISVWLAYCYILYDKKDISNRINSFLIKFVRSYPNCSISYSEFIRNCQDIDIYKTMRNRIDTLDLMHNNPYNQWKILALSILSFDKTIIDDDGNHLAQLYHDLVNFFDFALLNNDSFHSVEKLVITILLQLQDIEQIEDFIVSMLKKFEDQYDLWIHAINIYKYNFDYSKTHELFLKAIEKVHVMDWPEQIIEEWLHFEQFMGSRESYLQAMITANRVMKQIDNSRQERLSSNGKRQIHQVIEDEKDNGNQESDMKKQKLQQQPKRNRENFTIKVSNILEKVEVKNLKDFFQECGTIKEIKMIEGTPKSATIEFTNEKEVFSALTKNFKVLEGQELSVSRFVESTLFVSNYPPSYSQDKIREMFSKIGTLVGIRFPSQKVTNRTRRFCYVDYSNSDDAKQAILIYDGKEFQDELNKKKYTMVVTVSDPSVKKNRESPLADRKVRVTNIPFMYNQDQIAEIFMNLEVQQVTIPKVSKERNPVYNNDGIAIVLFKSIEGALEALKYDNVDIEGRSLHVAKVSNSKPQISDNQVRANRFTEVATIGITNVDSSLTPEQIQIHFKKLIGPVKKVEIFPENNASLVEFESVADAGKAGMLINNELNNKPLNIVSKSDIINLITGKTQFKKPRPSSFVPPALLKRRR